MQLQTEVARRLAGPTGLQVNMEFIFEHMRLAALRVASAAQFDVTFRKVTNWLRCEWGAETYAACRSIVSTAKASRASSHGDCRDSGGAALFLR
jgi:hypothetical protein